MADITHAFISYAHQDTIIANDFGDENSAVSGQEDREHGWVQNATNDAIFARTQRGARLVEDAIEHLAGSTLDVAELAE